MEASKLRVFVAVRVRATAGFRKVLARLDRCGRAVRAVPPDQLHVTLKFLGDVSPEKVHEICQRLDDVVQPREPFDAVAAGTGVFPHRRRPLVTWVGLAPAEPWVELANAVDDAMSAAGFPPETRDFRPHVTIARVKAKPPDEFWAILSEFEQTEFARESIHEIELVQSTLSHSGPSYHTLHAAPLGQTEADGQTEAET